MNNFKKWFKGTDAVFFIYMTVVAGLVLFVSMQVATAFFDGTKEDCVPMKTHFTYETSDGRTGRVRLPARIAVSKDGYISVSGVLPEKIREGMFLAYYPYHQEAHVYIDGELRGVYTGTESVFETNLPSKGLRFLPVTEADAGKELNVIFTSRVPRYIGVVNEFLIGSKSAIARVSFRGGLFVLLVGVFLTFCGVTLIGISFAELKNSELMVPYAYLGLTATFAGNWFVLQTNAAQMVIGNTAWLQWMESMSLAMITLPLVRFFDACEKGRFRRTCNVICSLDVAVILLMLFLTTLDYDALSFIWMVHIAMFASSAFGLVTIGYLRIKGDPLFAELRWVAAAGVFLMLFGTLELVVYYIRPNLCDGTFFVIGVVTFLFGCFVWVRRLHHDQETEEEAVTTQARVKKALLQNISAALKNPSAVIERESEAIAQRSENEKIKKAAEEIHELSGPLLAVVGRIGKSPKKGKG
ncbi:MAG: hypothetical protein IJT32_00975 [Lachnospiraceae bacterium]|nr:hypothetical protein [Lachnospiraceae bacterium]